MVSLRSRRVLLASGSIRKLGGDGPVLRFVEGPKASGGWAGRRVLTLRDAPAFELSFWCGTCPCLFKRLEGASETLSLPEMSEQLASGLDGVDSDVVERYGALLAEGDYLPLLLEVRPVLVSPGQPGDYFSEEQVETWRVDGFSGLPEYPATPYYRSFETVVSHDAHLFEFLVPMVPPTWNDRTRVEAFIGSLRASSRPTAVAVSTLDICTPAIVQGPDYYTHWMLTHFLLDGHHKVEAAATTQRPLRLLSLVAVDGSLAERDCVERLATVRARHVSSRCHSEASDNPGP